MTDRVVWVTGGGSGMGRASALAAAASGWTVVVSGRRAEVLEGTVDLVVGAGGTALALPLDVRDRSALAAAHASIVARFGRLDALVLAAGRNAPARRWDDQDLDTFEDVLAVNLTAATSAIAVALPSLRESRGVVVAISSYSGWTFQPSAGVAYSASKTALGSIVRTLNQQEPIRACHLCPGDVATDFLQQRPVVPDAAAQAAMLTAEDIGRAVLFVLDAPAHVRVDELVISPTSQR